MLDMDTMFEQILHESEVRANRIAEAKRVADIREKARQAILNADGPQPCMIDKCSVHARYFTTNNQFCDEHAPATVAEMVAKR